MRKVLAITVALMIAAIFIMPALGYTNQATGNPSYSLKSGEKIDYSFTTNVPAHNLTQDMVANKYSLKAPAVQSTRMPYSFQQGTATPYSVKLVGVDNAVAQGIQTQKAPAKLGSINKAAKAEPAAEPVVETVAEPAVEPVAEVAAEPMVEPVAEPEAEPTFSIEGMVVDDNQTGLADWSMNLTQDGEVIDSVATDADGKFAFADLVAGEYNVSEVLMEGWNIVSPAEGMSMVTITNASVTDLVFINQLVPVVLPPEEVMPAVAENITAPANDTAAIA